MDGCSVGEKTGLVEEDACRDWRRQTRLGGRVSSLRGHCPRLDRGVSKVSGRCNLPEGDSR
jgi:hypothetical protein